LGSYKYHRGACCPRFSYRSVDRQPNDRLGRSWFRPHLFEHRRQILRGRTKSYIDAHSDSNSNRQPYADASTDGNNDSYCNSNAHVNAHAHAYSNCYSHADAYTNRNADSYSHSHSYGNSNTYGDSNANTYTDTDRMHWEMFTHATSAPNSRTAVVNVKVISDA